MSGIDKTSDLERLKTWLMSFPGAAQLGQMQVDYTSSLPGCFGVFPAGLVEVRRTEDVCGNVTIENQYNFALYLVFEKAPGDDMGATINADWVMEFQKWVQQESLSHHAPTFGDIDLGQETISAQNGALYSADAEGLGMYLLRLSATFRKYFSVE